MRDIFFRCILPMSVTGGILYLLSLLLRPVFAKTGARLHKWFLCSVAALFLLPLPLLFSLLTLPWAHDASTEPPEGAPTTTLTDTVRDLPPAAPAYHAGQALSAAVRAEAGGAGGTAPGGTGRAAPDIPGAIAAIYTAGAAAMLAGTFWRWLSFTARLKRASRPVTDEAILESYREAGKRLNLRKPPALLESAVPAPLLAYLPRSAIVLPAGPVDSTQTEFALTHELTHYMAKDLPLKYLALAVCVAHWFNPLAWLFKRELAGVCECACDEQMARGMDGGERRTYAHALVACAAGSSAFAAGFSSPARHLKKRLRRLLAHKKPSHFAAIVGAVLLCLSISAVTLAGCGLAAGMAETENTVAAQASLAGASPSSSLNTQDANSSSSWPEELPPSLIGYQLNEQFGSFTWPVPNYTSVLQESNEGHAGIDIAAASGSDVVAAQSGDVSSVDDLLGLGTTITILHENGVTTSYGHLSGVIVQSEEHVDEGQVLGQVAAAASFYGGNCALSGGQICHFSVNIPLALTLTAPDGSSPPETELSAITDPMMLTYYPPYPRGSASNGYFNPDAASALDGLQHGDTGSYINPVPDSASSSRGMSDGHRGRDYSAPEGTPVYATQAGIVEEATYHYSWGNMVLIRHADGNETLYAQLNDYLVGVGQSVEQGQQIGAVGMTGNTSGPHLHLEVWGPDGGLIDPDTLIPFDGTYEEDTANTE